MATEMRIAELLEPLREALRDERGDASSRLARATTLLGIAEARAVGDRRADRPPGLSPSQLRRVLEHIEANLESSLRNDELAIVAGLSCYHFNVAFRQSVGESPHRHLIRRRVERAQWLMKSTQASLSEIAAACGLADQAHLTRLFRKHTGESPAAWRRAHSEAASVDAAPGLEVERHLNSRPCQQAVTESRE